MILFAAAGVAVESDDLRSGKPKEAGGGLSVARTASRRSRPWSTAMV